MLPITENLDDLVLQFDEVEQEKTQTFRIDLTKNIIVGKIDGLEALKQSIYLMLNIEADQHIIYPWDYGITTIDLIGKPNHYVMAIIPERIRETLLKDNRIVDVSDFEFDVHKNKVGVKFTVSTIYGDFAEEMVVDY